MGEKRLALMDEAGLDIQILSFSSPGIDEFDPDYSSAASMAVAVNDILHDTIKRYPTRFMGFAAITPYDVPQSVKELERAINQLGFVGWRILILVLISILIIKCMGFYWERRKAFIFLSICIQ